MTKLMCGYMQIVAPIPEGHFRVKGMTLSPTCTVSTREELLRGESFFRIVPTIEQAREICTWLENGRITDSNCQRVF